MFGAQLTDTAVLGGAIDAQGNVVSVVTVADPGRDRDRAAALTTLRYIGAGVDGRGEVERTLDAIAADPTASAVFLTAGDTVVQLSRVSGRDRAVAVIAARGTTESDLETGSAQLVADILASLQR